MISTKNRIECVTSTKNVFLCQNVAVDATFCVDSESTIRKSIAHRNLELRSKTRFSLLGSREVFSLRRKGRYEQTNFKNEFLISKSPGK